MSPTQLQRIKAHKIKYAVMREELAKLMLVYRSILRNRRHKLTLTKEL